MSCAASGLLAILSTLTGLWIWVSNDLTDTPLSTALLCAAGLFAMICVLNGHYKETK